jgi:beta-N-acetylhexosaminidase
MLAVVMALATAWVASALPAVKPAQSESQARAVRTWTDALLSRMTLDDKVGQLFVVSVWGTSADEAHSMNRAAYGVDTPAEVVRKYQVGGVIYFDGAGTDNIESPAQLARFSNGLQRAALDSGARLPLVVAVDQEGGNVTRVGAPATEFPSGMAVAAGRNPADARTLAAVSGHELRAMGVNQNFGPVADVNSNPANPVIGARSFSSQPDLTSAMVTAEVRGYQAAGRATGTVSSAAKHFPGHGDAATDSHTGLPVITRTADQWREVDLPPFRAAIAAGVDSIMTAHIRFPGLDPSGLPATVSPAIMTDLLRTDMGFRGVVVSDSLRMQGIREMFGDAEIPVLALRAGVDQLLLPPDLALAKDAVLAAVRSGRLTEQRIEDSVRRIVEMKWKRGILARPLVDVDRVASVVGTPAHHAAIQRLTDHTVTVLRNDAGLLPLRAPTTALVTGIGDPLDSAGSPSLLAARLSSRGWTATALPTGVWPAESTIADSVAAARDVGVVIVLTNGLSTDGGQRTLLSRLVETGKPVVAVAAQGPYDAGFVDVPTWVATYSWREVSLESLPKVLTGEISPRGKLPVDVPDGADPTTIRYPFDHGLTG